MTIRDLVAASGIGRLDAEILLSFVLQKPRSWLLAHEDDECPSRTEDAFEETVSRRKDLEPVALITGIQEFYGRPFAVTRDTLIPRPSTEYLVEETLRMLKEKKGGISEADTGISVLSKILRPTSPQVIVDVGTGSGCIAITLAKEGWTNPVVGVDVSAKALKVAERNAKAHQTENVTFVRDDGIAFVQKMNVPFFLVSNPPYIPAGTMLEKNVVQFEPGIALFAGEKGLDVLVPLVVAAVQNDVCTGLALELRTDQTEEVRRHLPSGMLRP